MKTSMTREIIETAFDSLGRRAAARGLVLDMMVYGGSCLVLASNMRDASFDVDAVYSNDKPTRETANEIALEVAREMGLSDGWLSHAIRPFVDPAEGKISAAVRNPFADYPRDGKSAIGLRVYIPHPSFVLAMKIMTTRWVEEKTVVDNIDAVGLMKVTGLTTKEQLMSLVMSVYPGVSGLKPVTMERMDDILADFERKADEPTPTWNT